MARDACAPEGGTGGASGAGIAAPGGDLKRRDDVALHEELAARPVADGVASVLRAPRLRDWAAGLADPAQALVDLARLEAEAIEFGPEG